MRRSYLTKPGTVWRRVELALRGPWSEFWQVLGALFIIAMILFGGSIADNAADQLDAWFAEHPETKRRHPYAIPHD